jgi:hypothetical protein
MRRTTVKSSLIEAVGHDPELNVLEIELRSGKVYRYFMVPAAVHRELISAPSAGEYFNRRIRDHYRWVELGAEEASST